MHLPVFDERTDMMTQRCRRIQLTWQFIFIQFFMHSFSTEMTSLRPVPHEYIDWGYRTSIRRRSLIQPEVITEREAERRTQIEMTYGITVDRKALITCEVTLGTADSSATVSEQSTSAVYLICPQVATSICYMNCTPSCVLGPQGCRVPEAISRVIESCTYESSDPHRLSLRYVLNLEALNQSGQWNCDYRGQRSSRPIDLRAVDRKTTTTLVPFTSLLQPEPKVNRRTIKNTDEGIRSLRTPAALATQPALFVILLVTLTVSLVLNVILSVRCALTKNYLDNVSRGKADPCLNRILCFHKESRAKHIAEPPKLPFFPACYTPLVTDANRNFMHYSTTANDSAADNLLVYTRQHVGSGTSGGTPATMSKIVRPAFRLQGSGVPNFGCKRPEQNGFHNHIPEGVFTTDRDPEYHLPTMVSLTPMDTSFIIPPGHSNGMVPCGTNESLTGSIVLTNDSASFTDGPVSANGISSLVPAQTSDYPLPRLHSDQFQLDVATTEGQLNGKTSTIQLASGLKMNSARSVSMHITQPLSFRSSSPESIECGDPGHQIGLIRSTMTPLIVRFPSGEAGLLFSSTTQRGGTSESGHESLNRNVLCRSGSNRKPCRKSLRQKDAIGTTRTTLVHSIECNPIISRTELNSRKHYKMNTSAVNASIQLTPQVTHAQHEVCRHITSSATSSEQASSETGSGPSGVASARNTSNASPDYVFLPAHKTELPTTDP